MLILHTILTIFLVELLVINGSSPVCNARKIVVKPRGDTTQLPLLSAASDNGDYHIVYQLEMKGSTELLEEWASTREHKFRLDMIGFDGTRTSFLTDGNTGESFRYKPFSCMRTDGDKMFKELSAVAPLFIGHSWTDDKQTTQSTGATHLAYGLGPLWMRIGEMGKRVKLVNNDSSKSSKKSSKGASGNSKLPFEDQFNAYEVEVEPELTHTKQPYKLRFYFAKSGSGAEFVDTIDWILNEQDGDGDAIAAATATDKTYQVRAKVIKVDYQLDPLVLKLPIGYGCRRRSGLEPKIQVDTGEILLFQPGTIAPSQVAFEVTTSRPNDDSLQASSWTSQRHSLRVMRLSLPRANSTQPESYYVTLDQFRELPDDAAQNRGRPNLGVYDNLRPVVSQTSGSKLKRVKRVWWAPDGDQGLATVYTIDQSTGECKVDHEDVRNQVVLTSSASYATTTSSGGDEAKPIVLSIDQIELLYNEFRAYSIIEEGEQFGDSANQFRDRYYEKRFKNFELKSQDGSVVWKGPVSIVKLVSYFDNTNTNTVSKKSANSMKADSPASRSSGFKIKLIIFFYSDKQDRILFKVVIDFLDNHEVSLSYAQQQMDVSSCFKPKDKQDLVIKYPLGSISLSRELESKRETIKQQLGKRLFWDDDSILRPFHIYNIEPSFNPFYMHLQMSLVDLPLTQTFKMERGLKLAPETGSDRDKILLQLTTSSAELCGQNCDYHNCFMFSYDSSRHSCIVVLDPSKAKTMKEPTSELYTYFDRRIPQVANNDNRQSEAPLGFIYKNLKERLQLSSDVIIERLEEFVNEAQASQPGESVGDSSSAIKNLNPLIIPINMQQPSLQGEQGEAIALVPSAVEHNLETMNEYSRELEAAANDDESGSSGSNATEETKLIRVRGNKQLRLEFIIRLEDRVFDMKAFDTMLTGVTYEDCEQHCELNDCRSFSYCYSDETCQVRGDFLEKVIKSSSRSVDETKGCNIYTLNYLSKFEPYGLVPSPNPKEVQLTVRGQSELDCATACMDQTSFACQSFYVCKSNPAGPKCLLTTKTAELMQETQEAELLARSRTTGTGNSPPADQHQCSFFARSYLAQFDKYLGKRINMDGEGTGLKVISDLETCARHCLKSQCLAFDACITESILGGLSCNIIVGSIRRDQLVPERKCTTFVVADKSHFNPKRLRLVYEGADSSSTNTTNSHATTTRPAIVQPSNEETLGKPDREASVNDGQSPGGTGVPTTTNSASDKKEDGKESQQQSSGGAKLEILEEYERSLDSHHIQSAVAGHSWLAKLFTLSAGILLGFGLILGWNEAYARGWLNRRLRNHNQASRMPPARF